MEKKIIYLISFALVLGLAGNAFAATITVGSGGDYSTIQAGINAAGTGDTVVVFNGTYTGTDNKNLSFGGKAITVESQNGAANCTIDCQNSGKGFLFTNSETSSSVLDGFTIVDGSVTSNGGGITCNGASPTITNMVISSCTTTQWGGGMNCNSGSDATISNCTITSCDATQDGGGIFCYQSAPTITNCTISSCDVGGYGGGISLNQSDATITNCKILNNTVTSSVNYHNGGGIYVTSSSPIITDCTISGNIANVSGNEYQYGGGICFLDAGSSSPIISNCIIYNNSAVEGGALYAYGYQGPSPDISNCLIISNVGDDYGGGLFFEGQEPTITNCVITGNDTWHMTNPDGYQSAQGGGIWLWKSNATIENCSVSGNTASRYGGGIQCGDSDPDITNSIFWDNSPDGIGADNKSKESVTYCDVQGGYSGTGNINADPKFKDVDGADNTIGTEDDNLRLFSTSPCIGEGSSSSDMGA